MFLLPALTHRTDSGAPTSLHVHSLANDSHTGTSIRLRPGPRCRVAILAWAAKMEVERLRAMPAVFEDVQRDTAARDH